MKILIETSGHGFVVEAGKAGALLEALETAQCVNQEYESRRGYVFKLAGTAENPERPKVQFLNDSQMKELTPDLKNLATVLQNAEQRWCKEYTEHNATKTKLAELEKKINAITNTATEVK